MYLFLLKKTDDNLTFSYQYLDKDEVFLNEFSIRNFTILFGYFIAYESVLNTEEFIFKIEEDIPYQELFEKIDRKFNTVSVETEAYFYKLVTEFYRKNNKIPKYESQIWD